MKENELKEVSSLSDNEHIRGLAEDGSSILIKKSDLYPLATPSTNGLLSAKEKTYLDKEGLVTAVQPTATLLANGVVKQSSFAAFINYMRVEGTNANLYYLQASYANNGLITTSANIISQNNSYGDLEFYYKIVDLKMYLYAKIKDYHILTINPLSVRGFNINNSVVTLPEGAIKIAIK